MESFKKPQSGHERGPICRNLLLPPSTVHQHAHDQQPFQACSHLPSRSGVAKQAAQAAKRCPDRPGHGGELQGGTQPRLRALRCSPGASGANAGARSQGGAKLHTKRRRAGWAEQLKKVGACRIPWTFQFPAPWRRRIAGYPARQRRRLISLPAAPGLDYRALHKHSSSQ